MYAIDRFAAISRRLFAKRAPVTDCERFYAFAPATDITTQELAQVVAKGVGNICIPARRLADLPTSLKRHFQPVK